MSLFCIKEIKKVNMYRIKKLVLISLINLLLILLFISIIQVRPISISTTSAPFFQLPMVFWIIMIVSPSLLYVVAKDSKNPIIPVACAVLYYFLFYSYGLYFMSHPTISDVGSSARFQEVLPSILHIKSQLKYFTWPVYFVFSKVFSSVLGIGPVTTINMGFFSLLLIIPLFISLFYKNAPSLKSNIKYFILPALYLSLSFNFINAQFVPQFLGLIYLLMLLGCYVRRENKKYFIFLIIFLILCVLTHAFMFVFFLAGVAIEKLIISYKNKKYKEGGIKTMLVSGKTLLISYFTIAIMAAIIILKFDVLSYYFHRIISTAGQWKGETWSIFYYIMGGRYNYWAGGEVYPLYNLVPRIYDQIFSIATKYLVAVSFLIVIIIFLKKRNALDAGITAGCISWFAAGLFIPAILGQRALQVVCIPLSKYFKFPAKRWSFLSHFLLIFILVSPSLLVANSMINISLEGDKFIQDYNENIAGRFMDQYINNSSNVLTAHNLYPTTYPGGFKRIGLTQMIKSGIKWEKINFILYSPKLKKSMYYYNISFSCPTTPDIQFVIYDNKENKILGRRTS